MRTTDMENQSLTIGQLAEQSGCSVQIVRHYEDVGLMPAPARTVGNQRRYSALHLQRLQFIRHARDLGFSLDEIRTMANLTDQPNQSCEAVDTVARQHLQEVERRIERLQALRKELKRMVAACGRGRVADCRVVETLAAFDHRHCVTDHHAADSIDLHASTRQRGRTRVGTV